MKVEKITNETIQKNLSVTNEQMKIEIKKILDEAKFRAIEKNAMEIIFSERKRILNLPNDQFLINFEKFNELEKKINEHTVLVKTLNEFRILLELIEVTKLNVNDILEHENAHANKAESLGGTLDGYMLIVAKNGNTYWYFPSLHWNIPISWDKIKKIKTMIKIANAPKEYGHMLSESDKEDIQVLQEQLRQLDLN